MKSGNKESIEQIDLNELGDSLDIPQEDRDGFMEKSRRIHEFFEKNSDQVKLKIRELDRGLRTSKIDRTNAQVLDMYLYLMREMNFNGLERDYKIDPNLFSGVLDIFDIEKDFELEDLMNMLWCITEETFDLFSSPEKAEFTASILTMAVYEGLLHHMMCITNTHREKQESPEKTPLEILAKTDGAEVAFGDSTEDEEDGQLFVQSLLESSSSSIETAAPEKRTMKIPVDPTVASQSRKKTRVTREEYEKAVEEGRVIQSPEGGLFIKTKYSAIEGDLEAELGKVIRAGVLPRVLSQEFTDLKPGQIGVVEAFCGLIYDTQVTQLGLTNQNGPYTDLETWEHQNLLVIRPARGFEEGGELEDKYIAAINFMLWRYTAGAGIDFDLRNPEYICYWQRWIKRYGAELLDPSSLQYQVYHLYWKDQIPFEHKFFLERQSQEVNQELLSSAKNNFLQCSEYQDIDYDGFENLEQQEREVVLHIKENLIPLYKFLIDMNEEVGDANDREEISRKKVASWNLENSPLSLIPGQPNAMSFMSKEAFLEIIEDALANHRIEKNDMGEEESEYALDVCWYNFSTLMDYYLIEQLLTQLELVAPDTERIGTVLLKNIYANTVIGRYAPFEAEFESILEKSGLDSDGEIQVNIKSWKEIDRDYPDYVYQIEEENTPEALRAIDHYLYRFHFKPFLYRTWKVTDSSVKLWLNWLEVRAECFEDPNNPIRILFELWWMQLQAVDPSLVEAYETLIAPKVEPGEGDDGHPKVIPEISLQQDKTAKSVSFIIESNVTLTGAKISIDKHKSEVVDLARGRVSYIPEATLAPGKHTAILTVGEVKESVVFEISPPKPVLPVGFVELISGDNIGTEDVEIQFPEGVYPKGMQLCAATATDECHHFPIDTKGKCIIAETKLKTLQQNETLRFTLRTQDGLVSVSEELEMKLPAPNIEQMEERKVIQALALTAKGSLNLAEKTPRGADLWVKLVQWEDRKNGKPVKKTKFEKLDSNELDISGFHEKGKKVEIVLAYGWEGVDEKNMKTKSIVAPWKKQKEDLKSKKLSEPEIDFSEFPEILYASDFESGFRVSLKNAPTDIENLAVKFQGSTRHIVESDQDGDFIVIDRPPRTEGQGSWTILYSGKNKIPSDPISIPYYYQEEPIVETPEPDSPKPKVSRKDIEKERIVTQKSCPTGKIKEGPLKESIETFLLEGDATNSEIIFYKKGVCIRIKKDYSERDNIPENVQEIRIKGGFGMVGGNPSVDHYFSPLQSDIVEFAQRRTFEAMQESTEETLLGFPAEYDLDFDGVFSFEEGEASSYVNPETGQLYFWDNYLRKEDMDHILLPLMRDMPSNVVVSFPRESGSGIKALKYINFDIDINGLVVRVQGKFEAGKNIEWDIHAIDTTSTKNPLLSDEGRFALQQSAFTVNYERDSKKVAPLSEEIQALFEPIKSATIKFLNQTGIQAQKDKTKRLALEEAQRFAKGFEKKTEAEKIEAVDMIYKRFERGAGQLIQNGKLVPMSGEYDFEALEALVADMTEEELDKTCVVQRKLSIRVEQRGEKKEYTKVLTNPAYWDDFERRSLKHIDIYAQGNGFENELADDRVWKAFNETIRIEMEDPDTKALIEMSLAEINTKEEKIRIPPNMDQNDWICGVLGYPGIDVGEIDNWTRSKIRSMLLQIMPKTLKTDFPNVVLTKFKNPNYKLSLSCQPFESIPLRSFRALQGEAKTRFDGKEVSSKT